MLICCTTTALAAGTAFATFAAVVAAFFASQRDIVVVARRNPDVVAAIPAVHATHESHEAPYATVASEVDPFHAAAAAAAAVVVVVLALETEPGSDCGLDRDLVLEAAAGQIYGHRRLPRQVTTSSTSASHKSLTMYSTGRVNPTHSSPVDVRPSLL